MAPGGHNPVAFGDRVAWDRGVSIELSTPDAGDLRGVVDALREWQREAAPIQLHPGDLGWFWQLGDAATAAALRTWSRGARLVAVGLLDAPALLRWTVAPDAEHDEVLARRVAADLGSGGAVLPEGAASVETPSSARLHDLLLEIGWEEGEQWTPLRRDLTDVVEEPAVRVEVVGPEQAAASAAVHRSAFGRDRFTDGLWRTMTTGLPYRDAQCLLAYDEEGHPVAEVTVWSAGEGRPGLLEPMGVHAEHRGRGYGRQICLAAAAALRRLGSSSAMVCTPSANVGAVATYEAAGFRPGPERRDRARIV